MSSAAGPRIVAPRRLNGPSYRVLRGGSWNNNPQNLRSAKPRSDRVDVHAGAEEVDGCRVAIVCGLTRLPIIEGTPATPYR